MKRKSAALSLLAALALIYSGCSDNNVINREPVTDGYSVSFALPNQSGKSIYTRSLGKANEFDLNSLSIYMFGENTSGSGYIFQDAFVCDGTDTRVSGDPLSNAGAKKEDARTFQIALGKTITGTYAKRFYFVGNLGGHATASKLCGVTLTKNSTKEADFKAAVQNMPSCLMFWPGDGKPCSIPMMSDANGLPEVAVDLSTLSSAITVNLKRAVARFDIVNNTTAKSGGSKVSTDFTIIGVELTRLNTQGYVFPNAFDHPFSPTAGTAARKDTTLAVKPDDVMNTQTSYTVDSSGKLIAEGSSPTFYMLPTNLNDQATTIRL